MANGFHNFAIRITKTKLVLATLLMLIWGSLPSTACVCADGTIKVFCSGICSGGNCCCSTSQRSCTGCACHSVAGTSNADSNGCVEPEGSQQLSQPCGCHRVAKDQATLHSRVCGDEDDPQNSDLCLTSVMPFSPARLSRLPSTLNENRGRPPDDIIILFRHLII